MSDLTPERLAEIRHHVDKEILPTADEVAGILRSGWEPSDRLRLQQACRELLAALDAAENDREWLEDKLKEEGDLVMLLAERGNALANRAAEYVHAFDTDAPDRRERCLRYTMALREWRAVPLGRDTPE